MREDWIECELKDLGKILSGGTPKTSVNEYWGTEIAWITPADLSNYKGKYIGKGRKNITEIGLIKSSAKLMPKGSVLFSSRAPIGYTVIAKNELCTNQGFKSVIPVSRLNNEFIYYYLKSSKQRAENKASGTTFKEISLKAFSILPFPLAPLPEQRAIVAKIEALFSDLDSGIASLKKAQDQLKVYRQAVLKKAFEGELTKEWRAKQQDLPAAEVLLEQIKEERERHYEQQLADWKLAVLAWDDGGRVGKKPIKSKKKATLTSFQKEYNLPKIWSFGVLQNIVLEGPSNGYSPKANNNKLGTKSLKLTATTSRKFIINESSIKYLGFDMPKNSKYWLKDNDILIQRANTIEYVGATAIFKKRYGDFIYPDLMMRIRLGKNFVAEYIAYFLNSNLCQSYFRKNATGTTGSMPKINGRVVGSTQIPLCSLKEQQQIVKEIESRLSVCDQVEKSIQENLKKATSLRQSILKKAFEGKLLDAAELEACRQENDWEPASVLLARIKEEKAQADLLAKAAKKKGKKKTKMK